MIDIELLVFDNNNWTYLNVYKEQQYLCANKLVVRQWSARPGFNPRSRYTKDFKNGTWYLLA